MLVYDRDDLRAEAPDHHRELSLHRQVRVVVGYGGERGPRPQSGDLAARHEAAVAELVKGDLQIGRRGSDVLHDERGYPAEDSAEVLGDVR